MIVGNGKLTVKPFGLVGHQSLGFTWNNKERFSLDQDPSNIARLLLTQQFPLLGKPRPGSYANPRKLVSRICWSRPNPPTARSAAGRSAIPLIRYFWQPDDDPKHGVGAFVRVRGFRREPGPDPVRVPRRYRRQRCAAGSPRRQLWHWFRADPVQQKPALPFCASSSTSACNARMRSRCTTTWRLHRG